MGSYSYRLIRSARKTMALQVLPDLEILVRAPRRASKKAIDAFVAGNTAWIDRQLERQRQRALEKPPLTEQELAALVEQARSELPPLVEKYSRMMGLAPTGIKITRAKTRFGSCSPKNSICFSCLLMRYPLPAIEYVVVHELAHIRHKNHGAAFYGLIASILPDYQYRRRMLKE